MSTVVDMMNQAAPKHKWTDEQRTTLAVLTKFYAISMNDQVRVFNHMFAETLSHEGFNDGLTLGALRAQLADLRTTPRGETYRAFLSLSPNQALEKSRQIRDRIEEAADGIHLSLWVRQLLDDQPTSVRERNVSLSPVKRRRLRYTSESSPSSSEDSETSCSQGSWETGIDTDESDFDRFNEDAFSRVSRVSPVLRTGRDLHNRRVQERPRLLFRAFDPEHQLRARRFLATAASIPAPPTFASTKFKEEVYPHLSEDRNYSSPFLSFTSNIGRTLKIIKKADHVLHLAILDYNVLEESLANRFGEHDRIYLAPDICKQCDFDNLQKTNRQPSSTATARGRKPYTGRDEFLVWADVPCAPIAVLNTTSIRKLAQAMKSVTELTYERGAYLADYLHDVQACYRGVVSYKLVRYFEVKGYERGGKSPAFKDFMAGIYRDCDDSESSVNPRSTLSETDDDERWNRWSATTSPKRVSRPMHLSDSQNQSGLTVEIPPLRASLTREYAREASLASNDDIQELVDRQVAIEASQFGILVDSSRRSSPIISYEDQDQIKLEDTHIGGLFLQQLTESAKDPTPKPARTPKSVPLKDLNTTAPNLTIDTSQKTTSDSSNYSTTKNSVRNFPGPRSSKPQSSLNGDKRPSSYRMRHPVLQRQRTTRTSTTLLAFNREEETMTNEAVIDDEGAEVIIIGTSTRRHQTVLSIRSRSLSEAAGSINHNGKALAPIAQSRIPQSKKKNAPVN